MKSFINTLGAAGLLALSFCNTAFATSVPFDAPEPGSLSLVGLAVVVGVLVMRRKK
jgi:hypothetical protein